MGANIIYIDDDLDDISIFQEVITAIDPSHILESFSESKVALEFLGHNILKPDIIFLDINMPVVTGKDTLVLIRRINHLNDVPVIMYSTSVRSEDGKVFLNMGATAFLQKGNNLEVIISDVKSLLKKFLEGNIQHVSEE